jgi:hypothetical protein
MRANPHFGLPQSRYFSTTPLTIGLKNPPSFASRLRTAKPVLPLETVFIFGQEPVEMMEKHPVENGPLRMSRTIDSRHSRRIASRNGPMSWMRSGLPEKQEEPRLRSAIRSRKRQQSLSLVGGNGKRKGTDTTARRTSRFVTPTKVPAAGWAVGLASPFFRTAQDEWLGQRSPQPCPRPAR